MTETPLVKPHTSLTNIIVRLAALYRKQIVRHVSRPLTFIVILQLICAAALASFNYGYSNNVIAGTLAQTSFGIKFLSGPNALQLIDGLVSG